MTVDPATGDLYVINLEEPETGALHRYNSDGTPDNFSALGSNVIDGHAGGEDEVPVFGAILSNEGFLGFAETQVAVAPPGAAGGTEGNIYVTDAFNGVIDIFAPSGKFLGQKAAPSFPCGVAVDEVGNVYVGVKSGPGEGVHKYTPTGATTFSESAGSPFALGNVCHVAADSGFVYAESFLTDVTKFDAEGAEEGAKKYVIERSIGNLSIDPASGHLFAAIAAAEAPFEIQEFDVSGASEAQHVSTTAAGNLPLGVAVDGASGKLYATWEGNPNVEVFAPIPKFELTVQKTGGGTGSVVSSPAAISCGATCSASFTEGDIVTLTATPDSSFLFTGWSTIAGDPGTCTGATSPCQVTISAAVGLQAGFSPPPPTVTAINPKTGPAPGGTLVTITGTNLAAASKVEFGATVVTCAETVVTCKVESPTEVKVTSPAHGAGTVDVTVTTPGGTSATGAADKYTYVAPPNITSLNPTKGPTAGKQTVTISGASLGNASSVKFGANPAAIKSNSSTQIVVETPSGAAGTVDVTVTTPNGGASANTAADDYTYVAPQAFTVSKVGSGAGSVTCNGGPCAATYDYGAKVTLAATADTGSTFAGFSSGGCSGAGPCTLTIEAPVTVTATFTANPPPDGGGSGGGGGGAGPGAPPSNEAVPGAAKPQGESIALKITVPGAGTLKATGKNLATANGSAKGAGVVTLKLKLTAAGKKALKKKGKLKVKVKIVFTPTGGSPGTSTKTVTFKSKGKK